MPDARSGTPTLLVIDASAAVAALKHDGEARRILADGDLHAPHLIDCEILQVFRREESVGLPTARDATRCLGVWRALGVERYAVTALLGRMWHLRHNLTAYDAAYVALAEFLGCQLITADRRLARVSGLSAPVRTVLS
jgi:predicted nucleic acid-binding protein